jgi:hypothetical protein
MLIDALKISFLIYLKNLGLYDYLALGWLVITFFILIFLSILIARKSASLALLLIIISLIIFLVAPFMIKQKVNELQRPVNTEITNVKKLTFSPSLIVEGNINNLSQKDFTKCLVQTNVIKNIDTNFLKSYINALKPIANKSIMVEQSLAKNDFIEYRVVFDDFEYEGNVTASIKAECY